MAPDPIKAAAAAYLIKETAANLTMRGADHAALLAEVAKEHGVSIQDLRARLLDDTTVQGAA